MYRKKWLWSVPRLFIYGLLLLMIQPPSLGTVSAEGGDRRARALLETLPGEWEFTLGRRAGVRRIRPLYDGLAVTWSEEFSGTKIRGDGIWGYDPKRDIFFSMGVHNLPGEYGIATGKLDAVADRIVFVPEAPRPDDKLSRSIFQLHHRDRFTYTALIPDGSGWKEAWTAHFVRRKEPAEKR